MKTTIDPAGRLVIPKKIRQAAGLVPGIPLDIRCTNGRVEIQPAPVPVRLVRKGRLVVAVPKVKLPPMPADLVERTLEELRNERGL